MIGPGLTCSANTLRHADLDTRTTAAAEAGFTGIGLRLDDYRRTGPNDRAIRTMLDDRGLHILELEYTWDWTSPAAAGVEAEMWRLADAVGYRQLNVPMFDAHPLDHLVAPFARLCDRAAAHGVRVGLEFIPYSHVRTLGEAWQVVASAGRANGGVIIDLWHWFRSGAVPADLTGIPADRITSVQLCDVLAEPMPDMTTEARHHRILPGRGAGDTAAVLSALRAHGVDAPCSVEVFSDELDALPPARAAQLAYDAGYGALNAS